MRKISLVFIIIVLLQSCVPVESYRESPPSPTIEVVGTPVNPAEMKMGEAVIIYARSGGFAGISEEWRFYEDGRVISIDGSEYNLDASQITELLTEIKMLGFFEMRDSGKLFSDCRDCFNHQLTVRSGEDFNSVSVVDGTSDTPDQFWKTVEKINGIIQTLTE
jgi:hypothetical protein